MLEVPEWIVSQNEADRITATDNSTRRRLEAKGLFPKRFQITENGATGYLTRLAPASCNCRIMLIAACSEGSATRWFASPRR